MSPSPPSLAVPPSPLDEADYAAFAWARYRRILWWMALVSLVTTLCVIGGLWIASGPLGILFMAFTAMGIIGTIMLGAALMGLAFLSSGTGHDDRLVDPLAGGHPLDD